MSGTAAAEFYPSIAATGFGRLLGRAMNVLPIPVGRVRLSHVVMAPVVIPFAVAAYVVQKVTGSYYRLTADAVEEWPMIGRQPKETVRLSQIDTAEVTVHGGQAFFHAGDVVVRGGGETLLTLRGVVRPERVAAAIRDAAVTHGRTAEIQERVRQRA